MTQPGPRYPNMSIATHRVIVSKLVEKYGHEVCWPVIWYDPANLRINAVTFEVNKLNQLNQNLIPGSKVISQVNLDIFKINYLTDPHVISILKGTQVPDYIQEAGSALYSQSYDYITSVKDGFNTIDIDYLWHSNGSNEALEVSTFFVSMDNKPKADYLVGKFVENRAARAGAHQFRLLVKAASAFGARMKMVFVNTIGRTNEIRAEGNAFWFPLDFEQADRLHNGQMPNRENFGTLKEFLADL